MALVSSAQPSFQQVSLKNTWVDILDRAGAVIENVKPADLKHHDGNLYREAYRRVKNSFLEDFSIAKEILEPLLNLPEKNDEQGIARYVHKLSSELDHMQGEEGPIYSCN